MLIVAGSSLSLKSSSLSCVQLIYHSLSKIDNFAKVWIHALDLSLVHALDLSLMHALHLSLIMVHLPLLCLRLRQPLLTLLHLDIL